MNENSSSAGWVMPRNIFILTAFGRLCLLGLWLLIPTMVRAQFVDDGETNFLDGMATNVSGNIVVGTSGAFTLLVITNGASVVDGNGTAIIGQNVSAQTNELIVTGSGSVLNNNGALDVGQDGSANVLAILNGATVASTSGLVGGGSGSSNNVAWVSGAGSFWQATGLSVGGGNLGSGNLVVITNGGKISALSSVNIGPSSGSNNAVWVVGAGSILTNAGNSFAVGGYAPYSLLVISNGGHVYSGAADVGEGAFNTGSAAVITGPRSSWNCGYLYLGYTTIGRHQLTLNNGGNLVSSSTFDIGVYASSNLCTVADAGSALQCQTYRMGYSSIGNRCVVSNGASLSVLFSGQATSIEGTFTTAMVTGANTVWTNAGDLDFGQYSNVLTIARGGVMADNNGYVENGFGKPNSVIVTGNNSLWNNLGDLHVADTGAQLIITNGGKVINFNGYLGDNAGNNGCFALVTGMGSLWTNRSSLSVGYNGATNQLVVANGGMVISPYLYVGFNSSQNQLVVSNASTVIANIMQIGSSSAQSNAVVVAGGTLTVSNALSLQNNAVLVINSGLCTLSSLTKNTDSGRVILNGGTLQSAITSYNFNVGNAVPFVVGDGTHGATFQLLNNLSGHSFSGGLVISRNGLVTGAGMITANVYVGNGGTLAAGTTNSMVLRVNGGLVLSNGCTIVLGLNPLSTQADNLTGLTNVVYGGTLQLTNLGGVYASGQSFKLFTSGQYAGAFSTVSPAIPGDGLRWDTSELAVDGVLRIFSTNTPPPAFGAVGQSGGGLLATITNGIPYDPGYVLTSTDLSAPLASWVCVGTNYFDASGTIHFTNAIPNGEPARYFQVQVN